MGPADGGPPGPPAPGRRTLYLTNYPGGGIGDFGRSLGRHLEETFGPIEVVETARNGRGAFRQSLHVAFSRDPLIANIGLTGWGPSGARNAAGFAAIGFHRWRGRRTTVLVHHLIEMFGPMETGYRVTPLLRWGAGWATRRIRRCQIVTFSPGLGDLLRRSYHATSVWVTPLPSDPPRPMPSASRRPRVVMAGYLAPYKGVDDFLDLAESRQVDADFWLVGRPHPVLAARPQFAEQLRRWEERARVLGVAMPGYLGDPELDEAMAGRCVGVLPYTSASGASAAFGLFAARGIPVVASPLAEFAFLRSEGAGIELAESGEVATCITSLLAAPEAWATLSARQRAFATDHAWEPFVRELARRGSSDPGRP